MLVATAAPVTPISGNGPQPKMKHGPSTMLSAFASHSVRIAITASPAPRKIALIRKIMNTVTLPPSMMRVKSEPSATIVRRGAHQPENVRREPAEHHAEASRQRHAQHHDLPRRVRGALRIFFADAARDDGGGGERDADGDRVDQRHHGFGDADDRDGVAARAATPRKRPRRRTATPSPFPAPSARPAAAPRD